MRNVNSIYRFHKYTVEVTMKTKLEDVEVCHLTVRIAIIINEYIINKYIYKVTRSWPYNLTIYLLYLTKQYNLNVYLYFLCLDMLEIGESVSVM